MQKGLYVVFEGVVASGKTTQSKKLYEYLKAKYPNIHVVWTREPGGSEVADEIRRVVQATPFKEQMDPICEAYLYAASRAQTLQKIVKPVLNKGGIVIADRSFLTSVAFQGAGRGLDYKTILNINKIALGAIVPKCVLFINVPLNVALSRATDQAGDKFESMGIDFFSKVEKGYNYLSSTSKYSKIWNNVGGNAPIDTVFNNILKAINPYLKNY